MTRAVRPRTLRRIASRERQRGYLGLSSYRRLAASALSGPSFAAGLLTSIVPDKAAPGTAPTFTRATTKSFVDWEGVVRTAIAGEACFTGARRVQNQVLASENISGAGWTLQGLATRSGQVLTMGATGDFIQVGVVVGTSAGAVFTCSALLSGPAGAVQIDMSATGMTPVVINLTAVPTRYAFTVTTISTSGTFRIGRISGASGTATQVTIGNAQVELITGQSNQNPSEYVSVGVLSAPFQGANVDGVQYFATQNGNTVASNVVTAGTGVAIPSSVLLGYSAWQQSTNVGLQSEDLTTTWVVTACTVGANAVVGPDGNTTADKVQEDATTAAHFVKQSITKAASALVYTLSVYLKQAERTWANVQAIDTASNGAQAWFNLATGSVGTTGSFGTTPFTAVSATITPSANGFYRCTLTFTTTTDTLVQPRVATATADNVISFAGTVNSGIYAWGAQLEQNAFATPYIATTTAAVTRNADVLQYPSAGNVLGTAGTCYAEAASTNLANGSRMVSVDGATNTFRTVLEDSGGNLAVYDGTLNRQFGALAPSASAQKLATYWGGATCNGAVAGVVGAAQAFDGDINVDTNITIGTFANIGGTALNGSIRNVKIWNRALTDAQLQAMTT